MRARFLCLAIVMLLTLPLRAAASTNVVIFDELPNTATATFISNGYQGLIWSNFLVINGVVQPTFYPFKTNGVYFGTVTASNVTYNGAGAPAEIVSPATNFNFLSVYLTGMFKSNLNIEVEGFRDGNLVYNQIVVASATSPTLVTFNYHDIDRLHFSSFGGQPAFDASSGTAFVMDNFTFEFVPEPTAFLLTAAGALLLGITLKRKRT
jgi:hypothetical protein